MLLKGFISIFDDFYVASKWDLRHYIIGKLGWKIDAGSETLGCLVVSENGQIAVCETPIPADTDHHAEGKKDSKIHVFDLKVK